MICMTQNFTSLHKAHRICPANGAGLQVRCVGCIRSIEILAGAALQAQPCLGNGIGRRDLPSDLALAAYPE